MSATNSYTISELAKLFGISRSTLLYYDKKQLLVPSERTPSNYRLYNEKDFARLKTIMIYRNAGLSIQKTSELMTAVSANQSVNLLEQQLERINGDIATLRNQQATLLNLLGNQSLLKNTRIMTKQKWTEILRCTGFNDDDMHQWHIEFERIMPEAHQDFLESLNIPSNEIKQIRSWSK